MIKVEEIIGDLLLRYNCVIIPSFGGFVTKPVSASIDFEKGTMTPPGKALLFNKQLVNNDGLIISELAHRTNLSFEKAEVLVRTQIADWNESLQKGSRVEIERVGILYMDREKNIGFEQDRFSNLLLQSFGLGSLSFIPEQKEEHIPEKELVVEKVGVEQAPKIIPFTAEIESEEQVSPEEQIPEQIEKKSYRKIRRFIAAACLLPIAFYSVWIPAKTDVLESGVISLRDFNPFYKAQDGSYEPNGENNFEALLDQPDVQELESNIEGLPDGVEYYTYKLDESRFIPVKIEKSIIDSGTNNPPVQHSFDPQAMNFIVGCFSIESNAINLVNNLKSNGMNARVVDVHNGLHRVSAGEAMSLEALKEVRSEAENLGMKGWVLK